MIVFLTVLLVAAIIATVVALIRGIVTFLTTTEAELKGDPASGPSLASTKSNKMMQMRIFFQALAITIVVLILLLTQRG